MRTKHHSFRANGRRRQGAALVEGILSISTIAILFAGVSFFHKLGAEKSATLREARYRAWTATRPNCKDERIGQEERAVSAPALVQSSMLPSTTEVRSSATMTCNETPNPEDDFLNVIQWATDNGGNLLDPVADTIKGFFHWKG